MSWHYLEDLMLDNIIGFVVLFFLFLVGVVSFGFNYIIF